MLNLISNQDRSFESVSLSDSNPDNTQSLHHTNHLSRRSFGKSRKSTESMVLVAGSLKWDALASLPGSSVTPHIQTFIMAHLHFSLSFLLENKYLSLVTLALCPFPLKLVRMRKNLPSSNIHSYCFRMEGNFGDDLT